jgi:hypothetical protein
MPGPEQPPADPKVPGDKEIPTGQTSLQGSAEDESDPERRKQVGDWEGYSQTILNIVFDR